MTRIKICGITNLNDALLAVKLGADALGFNFYEKSPRYISPENVRKIVAQIAQHIDKIGVFVNEEIGVILQTIDSAELTAIQLHGDETPEFVARLKRKTNLEVIKAFRISADFTREEIEKFAADAILLDAYHPHEYGGTGETFDWKIAQTMQKTFPMMYLAGGLTPENIGNALSEVNPFAIDVCSGVELEKGLKSGEKMARFFDAVRNWESRKILDI